MVFKQFRFNIILRVLLLTATCLLLLLVLSKGEYSFTPYVVIALIVYQVWSMIRTVDDAVQANASFQEEQLIKQADELMLNVIRVMEDAREAEIVAKLLKFRDAIDKQDSYEQLSTEAEAARGELINIVNTLSWPEAFWEVPLELSPGYGLRSGDAGGCRAVARRR